MKVTTAEYSAGQNYCIGEKIYGNRYSRASKRVFLNEKRPNKVLWGEIVFGKDLKLISKSMHIVVEIYTRPATTDLHHSLYA